MRPTELSRICAAILGAATLGYTTSAAAYLDPGTGSIIVQGAIAAIAAAAFTLKLYWYKVKSFFTGRKADDTKRKGQDGKTTSE